MPEPSSTSAWEALRGRPFSFYPAIRNVEYNEWTCVRETWSEILALNSKTGQELWIPRQYLGQISSAEAPVVIVGLRQELEMKGGSVWPYQRTVLEMPAPPRPGTRAASSPPALAPARPRLDPHTEKKLGILIAAVLAIGLAACLLVVAVVRQGGLRPLDWFRRPNVTTQDQKYLTLTRDDAYHDVTRKLGPSERDQWISPEAADIQFQVLWYTQRAYAIVLMGTDRAGGRYIGAIHTSSRVPLDSVPLPGGGTTASMLRSLPKF